LNHTGTTYANGQVAQQAVGPAKPHTLYYRNGSRCVFRNDGNHATGILRERPRRRDMVSMERLRQGPNDGAQEAQAAQASEGRWPRICERPGTNVRPEVRRVAMISLHTSPLASLGRTRDAGGMNVYIRELARELGQNGPGGMEVDIFTRRSEPTTPPLQYLS